MERETIQGQPLQLAMLKICTGCGASVSRRDCHRNRYGEYICRGCQAVGIRHSPRHIGRRAATWLRPRLWLVIPLAGLVLLLLWAFYAVVMKVNFFRLVQNIVGT